MAAKAPKRGDHIINNGALKIQEDIIDQFLVYNSESFKKKNFDDLEIDGLIPYCSELYTSHERPLRLDLLEEIEHKMIVHKPKSGASSDPNSENFGKANKDLIEKVLETMQKMFDHLITKGELQNTELLKKMNKAISEIISKYSQKDGPFYIDYEARKQYLEMPRNPKDQIATEAKLKICEAAVKMMFDRLNPKETLGNWVTQLYEIAKNVRSTGIPSPHLKLVPYDDKKHLNEKSLDKFSIKPGYQDGCGDLWIGVANTKSGQIPGKIQKDEGNGYICYYSDEKNACKTKDFDFIASPGVRCVKSKDVAPETALQFGKHYVAIAKTQYGRIPGETTDGHTCFYPYKGRTLLSTEDFYWVVFKRKN